MCLLDKVRLLKSLKGLSALDHGASPFIAVKLEPEQLPKFYRSGVLGYVRSRKAASGEEGWAFVSMTHLHDCLRVLDEEDVTLSLDKAGLLKINSTHDSFESELRVHTVRQESAGFKSHAPGKVIKAIEPTLFAGLDVRPFSLASPPVMCNGQVMLPTQYGIVLWQGSDGLKDIKLFPREAFLKVLATGEPLAVGLTDGGYWVGEVGEFYVCVSGHTVGRQLYDLYNVSGVQRAALPADRLVYALRAAAGLCEDDALVDVDPKHGILTRDKFGNLSKFSILPGEWTKFSIFGKTAHTIVEAFSQTKEEVATLSELQIGSHRTMRLTRGQWTVNFKVF